MDLERSGPLYSLLPITPSHPTAQRLLNTGHLRMIRIKGLVDRITESLAHSATTTCSKCRLIATVQDIQSFQIKYTIDIMRLIRHPLGWAQSFSCPISQEVAEGDQVVFHHRQPLFHCAQAQLTSPRDSNPCHAYSLVVATRCTITMSRF